MPSGWIQKVLGAINRQIRAPLAKLRQPLRGAQLFLHDFVRANTPYFGHGDVLVDVQEVRCWSFGELC